MQNNPRLARLILDQVQRDERDDDWSGREIEIADLLDQAVTTGQSRIDLRNRLVTGTRATNSMIYRDLAEAISESLTDQIRDLDSDIAKLENDLIPSRLVMGTIIGLILGAFGAVVYGSADILTAASITIAMVTAFFGVQAYRRRAFVIISELKGRRTNYDAFRNLLRSDP
ncbi:hypothetical protein [Yoonia maritima]|uniref:hypothetical protein n=1 Tax=Yoonia maritima TaxID=1435347 RepID=UPI000D0FADFD|nr:hypothetical protein [Yoonia maritima]